MKRNIDIKEPCSESWQKMTPTQKGAFCDKCSLEVHDFSNKSGDEIRDILKLNIGKSVCGRLAPSQLDSLNYDFKAWNMNSKRSFQSALVYSLIVAFGMTLFGCEEDEEEEKIGKIQEIGMSFLVDENEIESDEIDLLGELISEDPKPDLINPPEIIMDKEVQVMGRMRIEPEEVQVVKVITPPDEVRIMVAGGIGYSHDYIRYLEDVPTSLVDETKISYEFDAFAFPNPAGEKTTLRVIMPEKQRVQIKLFNMAGQFIKDVSSKKLRKGESNFEINLIDLPKGTYIISIVSKSFNESVKFIKR